MDLDRHVVPGVRRHVRECLALDLREVEDGADLRRRRRERRAHGQVRVGPEVRERDDERRVAARLDVDPRAQVLPGEHVRRDSDDGPVHRRVDVGPGRRAHVERTGRGPSVAPEDVVTQAVAAVAEEAPRDLADEPLVHLPSDRPQREGAVVRGVVADRGHARDRQHQADRALQRDHREQNQPRQSPLPARDGPFGPPPPRSRGAWHPRHGNEARVLLQWDPTRLEREGAVGLEIPVPGRRTRAFARRSKRYDAGGTMLPMAGPSAGAANIEIPRWIQLVGLPLLLLFLWVVAGAARHVVFLFLVAALIAFLLNPVVRALTRVWIPRGLGVALVYLSFAAIVLAAAVAIGSVVVDQTKSSANRVNDYFTVVNGHPRRTDADRDVDRFQLWLDTHRLGGIDVQKQGHDLVKQIREKDVSRYTGDVIDFVEGAAIGTVKFLFSLVLVIVVSIYMLLDMPRLGRVVDRRFPPRP